MDDIRSATAVQMAHFPALMANFRPVQGARFSLRVSIPALLEECLDGPEQKLEPHRLRQASHHIRPNVEPTKNTVTMTPNPNDTRMRLSVG